jgi:hypothetical protein
VRHDREFDAWVRDISPDAFVDDASIADSWMVWLARLYGDDGPLSRGEVEARAVAAATEHASMALVAVLRDVEAATGDRPLMEVVARDKWLHVLDLSTGYESTEGFLTADGNEALVDVAEAVVDRLADREYPVLLLCPEHRLGLHPQLQGGRAVWVCLPTGHVVAAVGALTEGDI